MKTLLSFLLLLCFFGPVLAGTIDPNTSDKHYVEYATKFPFVGRFMGKNELNDLHFGSVVAHQDTIILTAAHVINRTQTQFVIINNSIIPIKKYIVHDKYNEKEFGYYDIAVAILEKPMGLEWYPDLYEDRDEVSQICSLSGFGMTGNFNTGAVVTDTEKRAGSNQIDFIDRGLLICSPSIKNKTSLEFLIASGDSGGGLFIGNRLAGIHSCVIGVGKKSESEYGSESGHTRISDHCEWIRKTIIQLKETINEKKK
jgi:hypothetical protein